MTAHFRQRGGFQISRPTPAARCDRCGLTYRRDLLQPQMKFAGFGVVDTGLRVCEPCLDPLDPQQRPIIPGIDPEPILNPRPINRVAANKYDWTIRPQPGWVNWRGYSPETTNVMTPIETGVGALTWSGHAPVMTVAVPTGTAALNWTGHAPSLTFVVTPGVASLTWTGYAPTMRLTVLPGVASMTWTGHAPAIENTQDLQVGFAALGQIALGQGGVS